MYYVKITLKTDDKETPICIGFDDYAFILLGDNLTRENKIFLMTTICDGLVKTDLISNQITHYHVSIVARESVHLLSVILIYTDTIKKVKLPLPNQREIKPNRSASIISESTPIALPKHSRIDVGCAIVNFSIDDDLEGHFFLHNRREHIPPEPDLPRIASILQITDTGVVNLRSDIDQLSAEIDREREHYHHYLTRLNNITHSARSLTTGQETDAETMLFINREIEKLGISALSALLHTNSSAVTRPLEKNKNEMISLWEKCASQTATLLHVKRLMAHLFYTAARLCLNKMRLQTFRNARQREKKLRELNNIFADSIYIDCKGIMTSIGEIDATFTERSLEQIKTIINTALTNARHTYLGYSEAHNRIRNTLEERQPLIEETLNFTAYALIEEHTFPDLHPHTVFEWRQEAIGMEALLKSNIALAQTSHSIFTIPSNTELHIQEQLMLAETEARLCRFKIIVPLYVSANKQKQQTTAFKDMIEALTEDSASKLALATRINDLLENISDLFIDISRLPDDLRDKNDLITALQMRISDAEMTYANLQKEYDQLLLEINQQNELRLSLLRLAEEKLATDLRLAEEKRETDLRLAEEKREAEVRATLIEVQHKRPLIEKKNTHTRQHNDKSISAFFARHWVGIIIGGLLCASLVIACILWFGLIPTIITMAAITHLTLTTSTASLIGACCVAAATALGSALGIVAGIIYDSYVNARQSVTHAPATTRTSTSKINSKLKTKQAPAISRTKSPCQTIILPATADAGVQAEHVQRHLPRQRLGSHDQQTRGHTLLQK